MVKLTLSLTLFAAFVGDARACETALVSGFDDVMRQANNTGLLRAARRLLSPDVAYAGMPELYHLLACAETAPEMYVVSAISTAFKTRAHRFLGRSGFPTAKLYFRSWILQWSPEQFKRKRIARLLAAHPSRRFIFVFDNSATSIRLAHGLLNANSTRVAAIYLRETVRRDLPQGATPFITAFDVVASEFAAGRVTANGAARVAEAVLAASDPHQIIPDYSYCPTGLPSCLQGKVEILHQCERVQARVREICTARERARRALQVADARK